MSRTALVVLYCLFILLASLAGGWLPLMLRLTHRVMQVALSFVAGVMLGVGVLHLLPHAIAEAGSVDAVVQWMLLGFVAMFFLERVFHFHSHEAPDGSHSPCDHDIGHEHHLHDAHDHDHAGHHGHADDMAGAHPLSWAGVAIGLSLHTLADGVALGAAVTAEYHAGSGFMLAGLGTFLAIVLHKPFDALAIGTLMTSGGWSTTARHAVNAIFALMIPLGALVFFFGLTTRGDEANVYIGYALAFSAGTFLCISASDLLPELQFHRHDRLLLSVALLLGLALAWAIGLVESHGHDHHHSHRHASVVRYSVPDNVRHRQPEVYRAQQGAYAFGAANSSTSSPRARRMRRTSSRIS
ncbi:MAG: ZIP family metal transporter [Pirellulales bacterium]|nr:ZIP family metal transporter [Pirellulales bacterium]